MNRPARRYVHRGLTCLAVVLLVASCEEATGGAVDLSWTLRTNTPADIDCVAARVDKIQLNWDVDGQQGFVSWPCKSNRAITAFEIPVGDAQISVTPLCVSGPATSETYETPAPVVRNIEAGQAISLGAVVISVQATQCDEQPCICLP